MMKDLLIKTKKKYTSLSKPVKAALWFTFCNFALKGISFICMPLYTKLMPADQYGVLNVINSYESIFIIFATFELSLGAFQRGLLKYKDDTETFEQSIVLLSNILTVIFFLLVMIFWKPFSGFTGISFTVFSLMIMYFLVYTPYNCWLNRKRFAFDYKPAVAVTLAMALAANLLPIISLKKIGSTANVKVISTLAISILFCLPFWLRRAKISHLTDKAGKVKEYFKYALLFQGPLVFHSLSYYLLNQSDRVMIDMFANSEKVAYYSVAYSLASVIVIIQNSLNQVLKPWRFQKLEAKKYSEVRNISNSLIILIGFVIILFSLAVPTVLQLLFKPEYYEATKTMPAVTFSVFFIFLYSVFVDIESYYAKTKYIAYVSVFCALLNVVLNYFGIRQFGYTACAYTTLICYILMALLHYLFMRKSCRESGVTEQPVDSRFILIFSLFILAMFVLVSICYQSDVIRYTMCVVLLIMAFVMRKKIKSILNTVLRRS